ncbi:MAG: NUDIX hydrolase [Pyrinomonadaceae bacterium]|nr:NUDIX hydrolase [Pyrinomonadaceae bacterium]
MKPKLLDSRKVFDGRVFSISEHEIEEEGRRYIREIIDHNGSAVVLPIHSNGDFELIRQYRHASGDFLIEIPAGTIEPGESPLDCATREVEEETGYRAGSLSKITEFYVSPGFLSEKMHLFAASDLTKSVQNTDEDEIIQNFRVSPEEALELVHNGGISDAKTMIGILLTQNAEFTNK